MEFPTLVPLVEMTDVTLMVSNFVTWLAHLKCFLGQFSLKGYLKVNVFGHLWFNNIFAVFDLDITELEIVGFGIVPRTSWECFTQKGKPYKKINLFIIMTRVTPIFSVSELISVVILISKLVLPKVSFSIFSWLGVEYKMIETMKYWQQSFSNSGARMRGTIEWTIGDELITIVPKC